MSGCALHGAEHCPLCDGPTDPISPEADAYFGRFQTSPFNMAVDGQGTPLPYNAEEVRAITERSIDQGKILAVVSQMPNGDLAVNVFGPPSQELVNILEQTAAAYKRVLKGH